MTKSFESVAKDIESGSEDEENGDKKELKRKSAKAVREIAKNLSAWTTEPIATTLKFAMELSKASLDYCEKSLGQYE